MLGYGVLTVARVIGIVGWLLLCVVASNAASSTVGNLPPAGALTGSEISYCIQSGADAKCILQAIADSGAVNPLFGYNASGSNTATTGTISASSTSLTVASATGWSVGMGIAVANAGTGGNTELITKVNTIVGTTFTLNNAAVATATTQAVNHDDTAAISAAMTAAMTAGKPLHLSTGNYNVTSGLTAISSPLTFFGDGATQSTIINRSATANVFTINYQTTVLPTALTVSALLQNFSVTQSSSVTPTAGAAFQIGAQSGAGHYLSGLVMQNILMNTTWAGITTSDGIISNWFLNLHVVSAVSGCGINYNSIQPSGDNHWNDDELSGIGTALCITKSDTQEFTNLKTNGAGVIFSAPSAATDIFRVRFVNPSIESGDGVHPNCGFDFGTHGATQVTIIGGEIGGIINPLCNSGNVAGGLSVDGVMVADNSFTTKGILVVKTGLPTSCTSQVSGTLWNNSNVVNVCP